MGEPVQKVLPNSEPCENDFHVKTDTFSAMFANAGIVETDIVGPNGEFVDPATTAKAKLQI